SPLIRSADPPTERTDPRADPAVELHDLAEWPIRWIRPWCWSVPGPPRGFPSCSASDRTF
ncbi:MAG TPA: hypothetical protein VGW74_15095, partial [Propionibacteriaceae bacterium]|nr:hypothetical protein [Propionibacteriaceae bacterium]